MHKQKDTPTYRGRVLIVDDHPRAAEGLREVLTRYLFYVRTAFSREEAVRELVLDRFDVLVVDWILPDGDSREILDFGRRYFPEASLIVHSAYETSDGHSATAGAHQFVLKGASPDVIVNAVERGLQQSQTRRREAAARYCGCWAREGWFIDVLMPGFRLSNRFNRHAGLVSEPGGLPRPAVLGLVCEQANRMEPVLEFDCREGGPARFEEAVFGCARAGSDCFVAPGLAEMANGGTLALHHIHLLTEQQQEKLAQTTREGVVRRLGSDRDIETRYRLVMTVEADRSFRESVGVLCPRLRELVQPDWVEVPRICGYSDRVMSFVTRMLETYAGSRQCLGPAITEFSTHYPLSCTLSDLKRAVERASEVGAEGPVEGEDLGIPILEGLTAGGGTTKRHFVSWAESKRAFETYYLCRLLAEAEGNVTQAAALSGRGRQQIHRALKKCGISGAAFRRAEGECR